MKKRLLFFLPLLLCTIFLLTDNKNVNAAIFPITHQWADPPTYPYRATQTTSYQNRFLWQNNHIYTNVDYGTWIKPGQEWKTWYQAPHWDGDGTYVDYTIARKFFGQDNFWLSNLNTGAVITTWAAPRMNAIYGEPYPWSPCGPTVYRRETGWIDIGGAKPNTPSGYAYRSGTNYYFNVSGTSSNLANLKADFSYSSAAGSSYVNTGSGISAQAEDYVVGFQYIIDQNPATDVNLYNSTYSPNGNIDVTGPFQSDRTWYIHIATRSYTNILSDRLDRPLQDASLKTTLTLTGDEGIASVVGAGQYYPGQTVKINATLKPEGVKWKGWKGN